jgi:hypothetical protein
MRQLYSASYKGKIAIELLRQGCLFANKKRGVQPRFYVTDV